MAESSFQIQNASWQDVVELQEYFLRDNPEYIKSVFFNLDLLRALETSSVALVARSNSQIWGLIILDRQHQGHL